MDGTPTKKAGHHRLDAQVMQIIQSSNSQAYWCTLRVQVKQIGGLFFFFFNFFFTALFSTEVFKLQLFPNQAKLFLTYSCGEIPLST